MIEESELKKLYYSIGEVSKMFGVNSSLIRFWEKEFKSINPKKNKKGNRLFLAKDILELQKIYQLVKIEGYTLEGAKKILKDGKTIVKVAENKPFDKEELIKDLERIRARLIKLKD